MRCDCTFADYGNASWYSFILVECNHGGITKVCWHVIVLPNGPKDVVECLESCGTKCLVQFSRNSICFRSFAIVYLWLSWSWLHLHQAAGQGLRANASNVHLSAAMLPGRQWMVGISIYLYLSIVRPIVPSTDRSIDTYILTYIHTYIDRQIDR